MIKSSQVLIPILILLAFGLSIWAYPSLPDPVVTHWGINGQPDGYSQRWFGTFLMPALLVGLTALFIFLPKLDPLKKNWAEFRGSYSLFITLLVAFLVYIHGLTLFSNIYPNRFNIGKMMMPALAGLLLVLGYIMPKLKRNWFIGIRTPWTISNDESWRKTHLLGAKLFTLAGLASLTILISPVVGFWVFMSTLLGSTVILVVYSYLVYRSETEKLN